MNSKTIKNLMTENSQDLTNNIEKPMRTVHSFVKRVGRLTKKQKESLEKYYPIYGLKYDGEIINFEKVFQNSNPVVLEIGFGMGDSLIEMALNNPEINYLGIEVHTPGVGNCLYKIYENNIKNIRVIEHDAIDILDHSIKSGSLAGFQLFFPDPWPKKKHNKRRIVQEAFIKKITRLINPNGFIHIATDHAGYQEHISEVMQNSKLINKSEVGNTYGRVLTKFENRGLKLGHEIWDGYYLITLI
ncbi:MAG: tRNA (guanosine(46)-N7)-methyltransferase TrmB [Psittacicella sp.]